MPRYIGGKYGTITAATLTFHVTEWSATLNTAEVEVTNTASVGDREYISGIRGGDGSFSFVWELDDPITQKVTNITRGSQWAFVGNIGDPAAASQTVSGTVQITSIDINSTLEGRVEGSASFVFSGPITVPV